MPVLERDGASPLPPSLLAHLERREDELRRRDGELREALRAATAAAARARAEAGAQRGAAERAAAGEAAARARLAEAHASLRESLEREAAAGGEAEALLDAATARERELAHLARDRNRLARLAETRERKLAEQFEQLGALKRERRVLMNRSVRLERLQASRTYRLAQLGWRLRGAMRRPSGLLTRRGGG